MSPSLPLADLRVGLYYETLRLPAEPTAQVSALSCRNGHHLRPHHP